MQIRVYTAGNKSVLVEGILPNQMYTGAQLMAVLSMIGSQISMGAKELIVCDYDAARPGYTDRKLVKEDPTK